MLEFVPAPYWSSNTYVAMGNRGNFYEPLHISPSFPGIWAVINTAGSSGRGGATFWEGALRGNVLGALRVARTFSPLLAAAAADHPHAGRLFYIGKKLSSIREQPARQTAYLLMINGAHWQSF